jgi:hypothetical protein
MTCAAVCFGTALDSTSFDLNTPIAMGMHGMYPPMYYMRPRYAGCSTLIQVDRQCRVRVTDSPNEKEN